VVSFYHRQPEGQMVRELVRALGLKKCNFEFYSDGGGGWNCGAVLSGAMLVHSGICKNVLVFKARNRYSQGRAARAERANDVKGDAQFTTPFGIHHAAASFGPIATAQMARYGTTTLDFAHLAVTERSHAVLNQKAMMRKPITIEDHQNSRWIIYPFRLLDCCQESDGGVALVITSAERARDLKQRRSISCQAWAARVRRRVCGKPTAPTRLRSFMKGQVSQRRMSALPKFTIPLHSCA
jgi:acetyl-CoA acetyltransferase